MTHTQNICQKTSKEMTIKGDKRHGWKENIHVYLNLLAPEFGI